MEGDLDISEYIRRNHATYVHKEGFIDLLILLDNDGFRIVCHADGSYSLNINEAQAHDMRYAWFTHLSEDETMEEGRKIRAHPFGPWELSTKGHVFRS